MAEAPRGAGIGYGDCLDDLDEAAGIELGAAERARQQEAVEPGLVEERDQLLGQPALGLDALGESGDLGREAARPREAIAAHRGA